MAHHPNLPPGYPPKPDGRNRARKRYKGQLYDFGKFGTPDSIKEYNRWLAEMLSLADADVTTAQREVLNILIAKWLKHLRVERGADDTEVRAHSRATVPLDRLYGHSWADEFRLPQFRAVQRAMATGTWMNDEDRAILDRHKRPHNWCASYTNKQINRLLQFFQWCEENLFVPEGRHHHLATITSIHASDKRVRHAPKRRPLDWQKQVDPVLPRLSPQIAAMAQVLYLSGARPSEIRKMRPMEIDRNGPDGCWLLIPNRHKGTWRDHGRVILVGPRAQAILAPFLLQTPGEEAYIFRSNRKAINPYCSESLSKAVKTACEEAGVIPWCPYDLRHEACRRVRRDFGDQGVKVHLGHISSDTGKLYGKGISEEDVKEAARIAKAVG